MATFDVTNSSGRYTLRLHVVENDTSTANNNSTVSFRLELIDNCPYSFSDWEIACYTSINGTEYGPHDAQYSISPYGSVDLFSVEGITIPHDDDGSETLSISFSITQNDIRSFTPGNISGSGSMPLTTIPRATTAVLSKSTFALGEQITVNLPGADPSFTHTVTYIFMNLQNQVTGISPTYTNVGASCTFTPPYSLASQMPDSTSGTGYIYVQTFNGSTHIGDKTTPFTATVPATLYPSVSTGWVTVAPGSDNSAANGFGVAVQGYSYGKVTFDASKITPQYGASISSYKITCNGATVSGSPCKTPVFSSAGDNAIYCTVTDSRGISYTAPLPITVYAYANPSFSEKHLYRCIKDGTEADETGTYLYAEATSSVSPCGNNGTGGNNNTGTLTVTLYDHAGNTLNTASLTSVTGMVLFPDTLSVSSSYSAKITLTDTLGNTASYSVSIPTADVTFNLREGGKGAAFGKYAEVEKALELAPDWDLKYKGDELRKVIYPIGAIYLSANNVNPAAQLGGSWNPYRTFYGGELLAFGTAYNTASGVIGTDDVPAGTVFCFANVGKNHAYSIKSYVDGVMRGQDGTIVIQTKGVVGFVEADAVIGGLGGSGLAGFWWDQNQNALPTGVTLSPSGTLLTGPVGATWGGNQNKYFYTVDTTSDVGFYVNPMLIPYGGQFTPAAGGITCRLLVKAYAKYGTSYLWQRIA